MDYAAGSAPIVFPDTTGFSFSVWRCSQLLPGPNSLTSQNRSFLRVRPVW